MKSNLIIAILSLLIVSCSTPQSKTETTLEQETVKTKTALTADTNLVLELDTKNNENGFIVNGKTNLPDSVKLGIELLKDNQVFAQNFKIFVSDGKFSGKFGVPIDKVEKIKVTCTDNKFWQSEPIMDQLKFIQSDKWEEGALGRSLFIVLDLSVEKKNKVKQIIKPPLDYNAVSHIEGKIQDVSMMNTKRLAVNLDCPADISDESIENEIRYWAFEVWKENQDAKAIKIRCFKEGSSQSFHNGCFAPFGEWTKASENVGLVDYKLKID